MRPTQALISSDALKHNIKLAVAMCGDSVIAVVKSNGYGFGLDWMAQFMHNMKEISMFAVAFSDEGVKLRQQLTALSCSKDIITLEGFFSADDLRQHKEHKLIPAIHHIEQLRMLQKEQASDYASPMPVWLKHTSGMNRLGLDQAQLMEAHDWLRQASNFELMGIMTHFASANREDTEVTRMQVRSFHEALVPLWEKTQANPKLKFPLVSLCNSAGIVSGFATDPFNKANKTNKTNKPATLTPTLDVREKLISRPGLMLYGASPVDHLTTKDIGIKPAMQFKSRLMAVRQLKKGDAVGYEGAWTASADCAMGVVPVGYADGYPFVAPSRLGRVPVLVKDRKCFLGGRVSMDLLCLDLTNCPDAVVGDEVELWGENLSVNEVAAAVQCPDQRMFSAITNRVPRIYS